MKKYVTLPTPPLYTDRCRKQGEPGPFRLELTSAAVVVPLATSAPFGQTAFHLPLWPFSALIVPAVHFGKYWA